MTKIRKFFPFVLVCLSLASGSAYGSMTFDYSYTFSDGNIVSGSLQGDEVGNYVENVSDVSVFFNNTPMSGTVFTAQQTPNIGWQNGPIVSFNVADNNFIFINSDIANGNISPSYSYFDIVGPNGYPYAAQNGATFDYDTSFIPASWSLVPVPEPSTVFAGAALLLPFGLGAIRSLRNRGQVA